MAGQYHVRSISLPTRSHPSTIRIEDELRKLKTWEQASSASSSASQSICAGLSKMENLHQCLDDVLNVASTRQLLSQHQDDKRVDELLDASMRLLDICGIARDYMVRIKEHVRSLQSALRRRKCDSSVENNILDYARFRKEMKKQGRKLVNELKQIMNTKLIIGDDDDQGQHISAILGVLTEVNVMNISIFQSLFTFLSSAAPVLSSSKQTRWSTLVSKLMHKGVKISCEDQKSNELQSVDATLYGKHCSLADVEQMQIARKRLVGLESSIESLECRLECVFRHLIKTRTSLLNIISQ